MKDGSRKRLIRKQLRKIAAKYGMRIIESDRRYNFISVDENAIFEVSFAKTGDSLGDSIRIGNELNEGMGNGYTDSGSYGSSNGEPYVEYKIIPLNHSLEQKTDVRAATFYRQLHNRIIHVGDFVVGKTLDDGKSCRGYINSMKRDEYSDIQAVVVFSIDTGSFASLDPKTVSLSSPVPDRRYPAKQLNSGNIIAAGGVFIGGTSY